MGVFRNEKPSSVPNVGAYFSAIGGGGSGSEILKNIAVWIANGNLYIGGGVISGGIQGQSFIQVYKGANGDNYFVEFRNGIAVRQGTGTGS
jgi:hypothetical protein